MLEDLQLCYRGTELLRLFVALILASMVMGVGLNLLWYSVFPAGREK